MTNVSFDFCALDYLNQWLKADQGFHERLSSPDRDGRLEGVKRAASYYGVARNVPKQYETGERYGPALEVLDAHDFQSTEQEDVPRIVAEVARSISCRYGDKSVLSFTTKMLWLKYKSPFIIYDSKARKALDSGTDFAEFYRKWTTCYSRHKATIECACASLPDVRKYCVDQQTGSERYIRSVASQEWFHGRVLDIYLWHQA